MRLLPNAAIVSTAAEATRKLARLLIDASQQPMLLLDSEICVIGVSRSFQLSYGVSYDQARDLPIEMLGGGEWNIPQLRLLLENSALGGQHIGDYETDLVRPGMDTRRLRMSVQDLTTEDDDRMVLLVFDDLTDTRRVEDANVALLIEQEHLLRERAVLLQEMQHRIANSLQIIASVLMLKARTVSSAESRQHLREAHDRVLSVATVQQLLQEHGSEVEVGPYLGKLCDSLASSMIGDGRSIALRVRADTATISSHDAVSLGLVVTELVINALKHAFGAGRPGAILVDYQLHLPGWTLTVADDGVGRPAGVATKAGLGTSIVEALGRQLGANVVISDAKPGSITALVNRDGPGRLAQPNPAAQPVMV